MPHDDDAGRVELLRRVAEIANASDTVADAAAGCIDLVLEFSGWEVGHLLLTEPATGHLVSAGVWRGADGARFEPLRAATDAQSFAAGEALPGRVLLTGAPATIPDIGGDRTFRRVEAARACGITAAFAFPITVRDEVAGVVEFFAASPAPADGALGELLAQVGTQLGRVVERERHEAALAASEELARGVIDAASDAYVSIDDTGAITAWNAAAERTFGWRRDEAIGRALVETLIPPRYREAHVAGVARFELTGEGPLLGRRTEIAGLHRDGHELPVELAVWASAGPDGRWTYHAFVHDITERRVAARELQSAYEREREMVDQLTQLDRNKADFMSMISHELRTPLTSIIGYLDLLAGGHGGEVTERQREMIAVAHRNARRLLELIDDIVHLDRLESGSLPLERTTVEIARLVDQVVASISPLVEARDQHLTVDIRPGSGVLDADPEQLERVLLNLATNAVKFTPKGGAVTVVADGDDATVRLTVIDTGMGIPASEQPRLFTRFFRSSTARTASVPGTGLGLVIARSIVEAHGGTIEIVSAEDEGTVVTVTLPRSAA